MTIDEIRKLVDEAEERINKEIKYLHENIPESVTLSTSIFIDDGFISTDKPRPKVSIQVII